MLIKSNTYQIDTLCMYRYTQQRTLQYALMKNCGVHLCPASNICSTDGTGCRNLAQGWTSDSSSIASSQDLYCHINFWNPSSKTGNLNTFGTGSPFSYKHKHIKTPYRLHSSSKEKRIKILFNNHIISTCLGFQLFHSRLIVWNALADDLQDLVQSSFILLLKTFLFTNCQM